jgi:hypothetical protein
MLMLMHKAPQNAPISARFANASRLSRQWVQTGDQRCPLACAWFALGDLADTQSDEPPLWWPALKRFLNFSAGHLPAIHATTRN